MYPLKRFDERTLPSDYTGNIITCDVDKTYLDTDFQSLTGLLTIPLEWAEDKRTVPGMGPLLRALRFGAGEKNAQVPFYFVTASPPSLVKKLQRKTLLDRVQADGVTCKDWQEILVKRRKLSWLTHQLAYKICALLSQRAVFPECACEVLIGDDVEIDGLAYTTYAAIVAGETTVEQLDRLLRLNGCDEEEREEVQLAWSKLEQRGSVVKRVYILLSAGSAPSTFEPFGPSLIACLSPFQMALHMAQEKLIRKESVAEVAEDLLFSGEAEPGMLATELDEGIERGIFKKRAVSSIQKDLRQARLVQ
jgi:Phosphatidate phosphatase APP1, catalytic domain